MKSLAAGNRRRSPALVSSRRGFSLVDVMVSLALFSMVFLAIGRFVINLTDSSGSALERAHIRRELTLAGAQITGDFGGASQCDAVTGVNSVFSINDSVLGPNSLAVYSDVDEDGDRDLVAWRVPLSYTVSSTVSVPAASQTFVSHVGLGPLERAVVLNTAGCAAMSTTSMVWERVLSSVSADSTQVIFQPTKSGVPVADSGRCLRLSDCSFDSVTVRFIYQNETSGPVSFNETFPVTGLSTRL